MVIDLEFLMIMIQAQKIFFSYPRFLTDQAIPKTPLCNWHYSVIDIIVLVLSEEREREREREEGGEFTTIGLFPPWKILQLSSAEN